jgi:hypothetical protein
MQRVCGAETKTVACIRMGTIVWVAMIITSPADCIEWISSIVYNQGF